MTGYVNVNLLSTMAFSFDATYPIKQADYDSPASGSGVGLQCVNLSKQIP